MCGILVIFNKAQNGNLKTLRRRGPDEEGSFVEDNVYMGHTRLSIVNPESGPQPIRYKDWVMVINGELYNAKPQSRETDCHMVIKLIAKYGTSALRKLDGIFSFVAYERTTKRIIIARDPIGVTPLYMSDSVVSSLLTNIRSGNAKTVPPGHVADFILGETPIFEKYTDEYSFIGEESFCVQSVMARAVRKRLMGDVPWGVLLSGGLDSTIVAALACKFAADERPDYPIVHSFCIGLESSPDIVVADQVARILGTRHTSVKYTIKEGIAAIPHVIKAVETYDVTTVRASVPMWILARAIKKRGIKFVLSGEGSDELFAGYLYNLHCPNAEEMEAECKRKVEQLHAYDCMRANKAMGDHGVETRVPFLDNKIVNYAMNHMDPRNKLSGTHPDGPKPEKWWLRDQFRDSIPEMVSERTKAQFSDAVGSEWIDACKREAERRVSDEDMDMAAETYPFQTPDTKESFWYRKIFAEHFKNVQEAEHTVIYQPSIACSTGSAIKWHKAFQNCTDPSGDAVQISLEKTETNPVDI
tara:strand:+ start:9867 stop:11450 length:1584 start_codon:yes stop_codon:yes gene_type:complete